MNKLPDFVVYIVLARTRKDEKFLPWTGSCFETRRAANYACREIRKELGRGNCYVQAYGPWS